MIYIVNAFSLNMLASGDANVYVRSMTISDIDFYVNTTIGGVRNCIGHPDTDAVVRDLLAMDGIYIEPGVRRSITAEHGDAFIVAQYSGPRLPEGCTRLPEGASIVWMRGTVSYMA